MLGEEHVSWPLYEVELFFLVDLFSDNVYENNSNKGSKPIGRWFYESVWFSLGLEMTITTAFF